MKNWVIILAILILPMVTYAVLDNIKLKAPDAVAVTSGTPVMLRFSTPLCLDCKLMEKTVSSVEPKYQGKVAFKKVDVMSKSKQTKQLLDEYDINVAPSVIFINRDGKTFKKVEGLMDENRLEKELKSILKG